MNRWQSSRKWVWSILLALGIGSLVFVAATLSDKALRRLVWWDTPNLTTLVFGLGGAVLVVAPIFAFIAGQPVESRGGAVAMTVLPASGLV